MIFFFRGIHPGWRRHRGRSWSYHHRDHLQKTPDAETEEDGLGQARRQQMEGSS